jgi:hypothetical protein
MAQALKRRRQSERDRRVGGNIFGLLAVLVVSMAVFFYTYRTLTTGDPLWFSSRFDATPRQLTVIDHGQRTSISPSDPRFLDIVDAFNASISDGYHNISTGFSEATWRTVDQQALLIEATYAEPVKLRGKFEPTKRLLMLVSGEVHTTQLLFWDDQGAWVPIPVVVENIEPIQSALARYGFR